MDGTRCHTSATLLLTTDDHVDGSLYKTNKIITLLKKTVEEKKSEKQTSCLTFLFPQSLKPVNMCTIFPSCWSN